jgi:uncharacterized protein YfiM (DUF2279 family)
VIAVAGTGFEASQTVALTSPSNTVTTMSGSALASLTATSFQFSATLSAAGTYSLRVTNSSGTASAAFAFTVKAPVVAAPVVTGLTPAAPTHSATAQLVHVAGTGFQTGQTVTVTAPNGTATTLSAASAVQSVTSASFALSVTLSQAGTYTMRVTNTLGSTSAPFTFSVK